MAFSFNYLSRLEATQQLDPAYNSATGVTTSPCPKMFTYNASAGGANASTAQTQASGYFNGALGYLNVGDAIYVVSNDPGYHLIYVATNNGTTVTTTQIV